jgi:N-dimethylarginine dimethylaminohydrolase
VLVRQPPADVSAWRSLGWTAEPDPARLATEHEGLCAVLEDAGAEVVVASPTGLDAIYVYDPALVSDDGVVLLRPGKETRRDEPDALAGLVDVAGRLEAPAFAEGGDLFWLAPGELCAGLGYRTNTDGVEALRALLDCEVRAYDLPHFQGPGQCVHLLSVISPLADDLALVYPPLAPVRLMQLLAERGVETVVVPDEEFETLGCNALALAPRVALIAAQNRETCRRLEAAGVDVQVYETTELSKGEGGPTCLTLPLARG